MIRIRLENMEGLKKQLQDLPVRARRAFDEAMHTEAGLVIGEAQQTVPVRTGFLRDSAYVRDLKRNQHRTDIDFGYRAEYALDVHEAPESRGYKWLEQAFNRVAPGAVRRAGAAIKAALARKR